MIGPVLAVACCVALVAWILLPVLRRSSPTIPTTSAFVEEMIEKKASIYRSILDLDLDLKLGKLSQADHRHMRDQLERDAIEILRKLDRSGLIDSEELVEREIAEARAALRR